MADKDLFVDDILNARPEIAKTREEWLLRAAAEFAAIFGDVGESVPQIRVSVGWPGSGRRAVIGECWSGSAATDGVAQIFISPTLDDAVRVLDVLLHEMIHAIDENKSGHRGRFAKIAKAVGLEGPMTATKAGEALQARLEGVHARLGTYPHAALNRGLVLDPTTPGGDVPEGAPRTSGPKKQTTRMLKVSCAEGSGYVVRMTRKWLDEFGAPICPCHGVQMIEG